MTDNLTPSVLDRWITEKINLQETDRYTARRQLEEWQLTQLRSLITYARSRSRFYRETLTGLPLPASLQDFHSYPFTDAQILRDMGGKLLCVSQGDISRVVTLQTSGTSQMPKRVFFTPSDQEQTIDFFHHGMAELTEAGQTAVILLPCRTKGSVGSLLAEGLRRLGVHPVEYGIIRDLQDCAQTIQKVQASCAIGIPVQLSTLAAFCEAGSLTLPLKNVLLSTDYLSSSLRNRIERSLNCRVYNHFGMTESGLGGALECSAHGGMHLRENDLLAEIIDPITRQPLPDGTFGELVITTLTRTGMPLIRYRTGDIARILPEYCACGSFLRQLEHRGRPDTQLLTILDEILFTLPRVIDYQCLYRNSDSSLEIILKYLEGTPEPDIAAARTLLQNCSAIQGQKTVSISCKALSPSSLPYTGKRRPIRC